MQNPTKFKEFAEDCKRLAKTAATEHKTILLQMADAWQRCAEEAEKYQRLSNAKKSA